MTGVEYCQCKDRKPSVYGINVEDEAWTPFLERKDILVWRQEHPELRGLYAYKMYGKFDDITANEFLEVQTDLSEFRLSWDPATAQCHIIGKLMIDLESQCEKCRVFKKKGKMFVTNYFYIRVVFTKCLYR